MNPFRDNREFKIKTESEKIIDLVKNMSTPEEFNELNENSNPKLIVLGEGKSLIIIGSDNPTLNERFYERKATGHVNRRGRWFL